MQRKSCKDTFDTQSFPSPSFRDPIPSLRPKASGFRVESETETKTALNFEADSETETSPEPRVSVFRVRVSLLHHKKGIFLVKSFYFSPSSLDFDSESETSLR